MVVPDAQDARRVVIHPPFLTQTGIRALLQRGAVFRDFRRREGQAQHLGRLRVEGCVADVRGRVSDGLHDRRRPDQVVLPGGGPLRHRADAVHEVFDVIRVRVAEPLADGRALQQAAQYRRYDPVFRGEIRRQIEGAEGVILVARVAGQLVQPRVDRRPARGIAAQAVPGPAADCLLIDAQRTPERPSPEMLAYPIDQGGDVGAPLRVDSARIVAVQDVARRLHRR